MDLKSQKDIAAKLMKVGRSRVWLDPSKIVDIEEALTRRDIERLIKDGIIVIKRKKGISNARKKKVAEQKRKGRRKGKGSRKGKIGTRMPSKTSWIKKIRALRKTLKEMKDAKKINAKVYRNAYRKAKGGYFRNRGHLITYLEKEAKENVIKEEKN